MLKRKKLRHNEYYDMQKQFDTLYARSVNGQNFYGLLDLMQSDENIRLAYRNIKRNTGSKTAGYDGLTIEDLKKLSVSEVVSTIQQMVEHYRPQAVRRVFIPKANGKTRPLGIPSIWDRLFQQCILQVLEPICEAKFYKHSYGFRPNRNTHHAKARFETLINRACLYHCVDVDIKGFFDNVNHAKLLKQMWSLGIRDKALLSIISRLLKAEIIGVGFPTKGGVISPVLANLFLHYTFDDFMAKEFPSIPWARYADDGIAHCASLKQAKYLQRRLEERFQLFGLELNLEKTKIVYCKDDDRQLNYPTISFDFLGYTFRPRHSKNKYGKFFTNFLPAIADKAKKAIRKEVRSWRLQLKADKTLQDISNMFNKKIQGWINYYGHFYKSEMYSALRYINSCLVKWVRRKYKKRKHRRRAEYWLGAIAQRERKLFAHWKYGILPAMNNGSRMS